MRKFGWMTAASLVAALWMTQPAFAQPVEVPPLPQQAWIQEDLVPAATVGPVGAGSNAAGPGAAASAAPTAGNVVVAGQGESSAPVGPGVAAPQQMGAPADPAAASHVDTSNQAPAGDEGTVLSPVIVAGQGQNQVSDQEQAAREAAAAQAAQEAAAAQAAQEAAAAQAAEAAAQQAAQEAAAAQAAQEAAAAQQASGRQIDPSRPMVALTFDDGPQPSVGNRIMDCLAQYGGKATFFMVGDRVGAHAAEVQRMVAEGHEVANHSMNHKYLQKLNGAQIQEQVNRCNDAIQSVCGVRPTLMRLPGGNHNATVRENVHMPMIQWNIDTLDWKTRNADKTVEAVLGKVSDGDIVLMHELYSQSGDAALRIIPELAARGYQMVTVSEMAAAKGRPLEAGKLYSSFK